MKITILGCTLFAFLAFLPPTHAQFIEFKQQEINEDHFSQFAGILYNGSPLVNSDTPDGPIQLAPGQIGILTVSTIDRSNGEFTLLEPISFKIAIKNYRTNSIWMYSDKAIKEVDLEAIFEKCEWGDILIFIPTNKKYHLPRHEVRMMAGC